MNVGELLVSVGANISGFKTAMADVSSTATTTASTASAAASKINSVFSAAFGTGVTALAFSAANKFESAFAQIQRSTGATEEKLKGLEESFTNVYRKTAASSEDVAAALSNLSTRTGATGKDLEDLTLKTIKLAKTQREDLGTIVPLVTRAFGDWSIASNQQAKAMDYMRTVSQQTGTSVARLAEQVVYAGAPLRQLGYNFEQSTALIGKFEKEGVNTELVLGGMKAALQKFAREGITDTAGAWQEFVAGVKSGSITLQDVMKEVGAKRGVDLFRAITEGRFEIDEMVTSAKKLASEGGAGIETFKTKITKLQHEVEAVIAGHYQIITAIGLTWPALTALTGGFGTLAKGAVAGISTIVTAIQFGLVGALTAAELAVFSLGAALAALGSGAVDAALAKLQDSHADDKLGGAIIGIRTGLAAATGSIAPPVYDFGGQKKAPNANDYVNSLPAPKEAPGTPKPGPKRLTDEDIKKDFSTLGLKDLEGELAAATKAFDELTAAHRLNDGQVIEATKHINDLRGTIAELRAGYTEVPKASVDLLKSLGIELEDRTKLQEMGAALTELSGRIQAFVGPQQSGIMDGKLAEAWQNYAHAAATADDEFKKHIDDVPWLKFAKAVDTVDLSFSEHFSHVSLYVKTEADLNEEMRHHNDTLRALPEAYRPLRDTILDAFGAIKGVTEAFHYFNIKTPEELQQHATEAKRQYEIIKRAAGDAATATQIAWHKSVLAQIELDHSLGITDEELYNQRKRMAEDALKTLEGTSKAGADAVRKHAWSAADDMQRSMEGAFNSLERSAAHSLLTMKDWGDGLKKVALDTAEDMISIMLKVFLKPLEDEATKVAGKIGGALGGIFGGGADVAKEGTDAVKTGANAASGAASSAGGAASAATGWMGAVNMISGAVSAIAGVFSAIGTFRLEGTMNAVEHNTRYLEIIFQKFAEQDEWDREAHLMTKLDDLWRTLLNIYDLLGRGISVTGAMISTAAVAMPSLEPLLAASRVSNSALETIRDYAVLQVRKIDEFIVPRMDTMIQVMGAGGVPSPAGVVNIYVQGSGDPDEVVNKVVSHLKRNGVYV